MAENLEDGWMDEMPLEQRRIFLDELREEWHKSDAKYDVAVETTYEAFKEYYELCDKQYVIQIKELIDMFNEHREEVWQHNNNTSTTAAQKQELITAANDQYNRRKTAAETALQQVLIPKELYRLKDVERIYLDTAIRDHRVFKLTEQSVEIDNWIIDNPLQTGGKIKPRRSRKQRKTHRKKKSQRQ